MNNEQFERRMEFIVEQQAKNAVDIQKLQEAQAELTKKHNHLTEALTTVVGMVGKLAEAQERTDELQKRTDEQLSELTNKQAETDDRLNILIGVVERYFSGNGRGPKLRGPKSLRKSQPKRKTSKAPRKKRKS
jgi:ABC-type hemin transport system substrate-binding protein